MGSLSKTKKRRVYFSLREVNCGEHLGFLMIIDTEEDAEFFINVPENMKFTVDAHDQLRPFRGNMSFRPQTYFKTFENISFFEDDQFPEDKNTATYKINKNQ